MHGSYLHVSYLHVAYSLLWRMESSEWFHKYQVLVLYNFNAVTFELQAFRCSGLAVPPLLPILKTMVSNNHMICSLAEAQRVILLESRSASIEYLSKDTRADADEPPQ